MRLNGSQVRYLVGTTVLALCLAAGLPVRPAAADPERHSLQGAEVAVYNLVGSVEVVPGTGSAVVAEVTLRGPDAGHLRIEKGSIRGRETLRVVYPGDRIRVPEFGHRTTSTMRIQEDGTFGEDRQNGRKVVLSGREGIEARADIKISVPKGKRLAVKWGHGEGTISRVDAMVSLDAAHMPVTATDVKGALSLDIGSGRVTVHGATGPVTIDTGSGEVDLEGVRGSSIIVDTGSGEVSGEDLDAESLAIDTGSGSIRLSRVRSKTVALDSGSGEIVVDLNGAMKDLVIDTGSGDVSVSIPRGTGAELSVETGSGRIETNLVLETRSRKHNELVGRIGNGRGSIRIETGSGTVTVLEQK